LAPQGLGGWLYNQLARLEARLYQQMPPPDIALRLTVALETAKQRNRDRIKPGKESDAYLESRHRQSREWQRAGTQTIYDVDTGKSLPETILEVKKRIWAGL
jgi:thymidylate kinase